MNIVTKFKSLFWDFPYPLLVLVPTVSAQELENAELDVVSARWLTTTQQVSPEQVGVQGKLATLNGLKQLQRVTDELRQHNWYILDLASVAKYKKLGTRIGFISRFAYRFKQAFFASESRLRHGTLLGVISAFLAFTWIMVAIMIGIYELSVSGGAKPPLCILAWGGWIVISWVLGSKMSPSTVTTKPVSEAEKTAIEDRKTFLQVGRFYASINFLLFFLVPTLVVSLLWAIVSSPFKAGLAKLRRWEEIPLRAFDGELPQNVQDVAYGLGRKLPHLSFSLEVRRDELRSKPVMTDDPFFICRYGQRAGDTLYLWHELAV